VLVKELDKTYRKKALTWGNQIDEGESAAIALAMQTQAEWLLSDDTKARQFAEFLGLETHGSIGLLLWAIAVGHIKSQGESLNLLTALSGSSLWISDRVLSQAHKAIGKLYLP
jgi:predicted nucleic acid-binding protein